MPTSSLLLTWGDVVQAAFQDVWLSFAAFLPKLLGAIIVFLIGVLIAGALKKVVVRLAMWLKLEYLAEKLELKAVFQKMGMQLSVGQLLGWIVKWFVIIAALLAATEILEWPQLTDFVKQVLLYVPNVLIAVLILLAGSLLANFVRNVVHRAVIAARLESADFLAGVARWSIFVFSFLAALSQLQVAQGMIQTLFAGLVAMLAIAAGLAFGLGGKEQATRFLERLRKEITPENRR